MQDRDADRVDEGRPVRGPGFPVRAVRRLLLDAVLLVEETDLRLKELSVVTLRGQLLEAAAKLRLAADGLTAPGLLPEEDKR